MINFYFLLSTLLKRVKIIYLLIPTLSFSQVGTLNAFDNRDISSLYINTKSEKEILEDLIIAAINDAKQKGETVAQEEMKSLTGGLPLPPGMKLPF